MSEPTVPPETIELTFVPQPRASLTSVELDGETVVYDADTGAIHLLDHIATVVWTSFDGQSSLADVVDDLADAFSADRDTVSLDVLRLARDLGSQGLLDGVQPAEAG